MHLFCWVKLNSSCKIEIAFIFISKLNAWTNSEGKFILIFNNLHILLFNVNNII